MVAVNDKKWSRPADRDLENRIRCFLQLCNAPDHESVDVHVENGTVLVEGRFPSQLAHWLNLQCCQRVAGVVKLVDRTEVEESAERSGPKP
jgi:osmotically-inducible protein OsmY